MTFVSSPIEKAAVKAPSLDATIWLSGVAILIGFAILLYLDWRSPGLSPDELTTMLNAFP